jgi:hypothetical protein
VERLAADRGLNVGPKLIISSVVTRSHLRFARAMRQTVRDHHPGVPHYVLLLDALAGEDLPAPMAGEVYVPLDAVVSDTAERQRLTFRYDALELSCAMKPLFARHLFTETGAQSLAYFDCDMTLHAALPASALPHASHSIVLTPHWVSGTAPSLEATWLMYGAFNAGFFAVRNDQRGRDFLDFWWERCRRFCVNDFSEGLFLDQAWLNLAPVLFEDALALCRDHGMNVSWWNFHERPLCVKDGRVTTTASAPLVLFHWSQAQFGDDGRLFRHESALDPVQGSETLAAVRELHRQFARLIAEHTSAGDSGRYRYQMFSDGSRIVTADRAAFRHHGDAVDGDASVNPFDQPRWFKSRRVRRQLKRASRWITGSNKAATTIASLARSGRSWIR